MPSKILKKKPLVEAILEVKWALTSPAPGVQIDPHYKILLGRLYDKVFGDYAEHEQLLTATIPDEIVGHMVLHRFRHGPNDWPLLQVGPGILTLNDTHKYVWSDFRSRSTIAIDKLFEAHPKPSELKIESLLLRYIDAIEFDHSAQNIFEFLKDKMKVGITLPDSLFRDQGIRQNPAIFSLHSSFICQNPKGLVTVRFASGQKEARPALLWETLVESRGDSVPPMPEGFGGWIDAAHAITDDWFFKSLRENLKGVSVMSETEVLPADPDTLRGQVACGRWASDSMLSYQRAASLLGVLQLVGATAIIISSCTLVNDPWALDPRMDLATSSVVHLPRQPRLTGKEARELALSILEAAEVSRERFAEEEAARGASLEELS